MPAKKGANKTDVRENIRIMLDRYDRKHLSNLVKRKKNIDTIYDELCKEAARLGKLTQFSDPDAPFFFSDFPETQRKIDELIGKHASKMQTLVEQDNEEEWLLSTAKNNAMIDMITKGTKLPAQTINKWKQPHLDALAAFQTRKQKGMDLSERVWNLSQQTKSELELALDIGLGEGKSAADLSRDVRKFLNEPNKLFRRVRDKHGVLRLSKNAQAYHPGRGVYRSSYKNAIRMTGTENNMAYRTADHDKWGSLDFVIGIEIHLSNNHTLNGKPFHDICDEMQGKYPKDFKFTGWHPQCRCFATPILADWEEQLKVMDMQDAGKDTSNYHYAGEVKRMPEGYNKWMKDNAERIANAKSMPYFIKDNPKYAEKATGVKLPAPDAKTIRSKEEILEAANKRHEQRTKEMVEDIKNRWELRKDEMQYSPEQRAMFREIEAGLGIKRGFSMPYELADKQNANPNYYTGKPFRVNCQTCAPAYVLREWGFDVTALGNTEKVSNLNYQLSRGNTWRETFLDAKGNRIATVSFKDYASRNGWKQMNASRYRQYFDEVCAEDGTYEIGLSWKGGGGHCTIVKRKGGVLTYIEPQLDNSPTSKRAWDNIDKLCETMTVKPWSLDGAIRVDNAMFNMKYIDIFDKNAYKTLTAQKEAIGKAIGTKTGTDPLHPLYVRPESFSRPERIRNVEHMMNNRKLNAEIVANTDTRDGRLFVSLSADHKDLVPNIRVANNLLDTFEDMKITIRHDLLFQGVKNPEYLINGLLADRKSIEGVKGIGYAFKNALSQNCNAVIIDFDEHLLGKHINNNAIISKIKGRSNDFITGQIKECYLIRNGKCIKVDSTFFSSKGEIDGNRLMEQLKRLE